MSYIGETVIYLNVRCFHEMGRLVCENQMAILTSLSSKSRQMKISDTSPVCEIFIIKLRTIPEQLYTVKSRLNSLIWVGLRWKNLAQECRVI